MKRALVHLLPPALMPAAFLYAWIMAGQAEGWGGWAYGYAFAVVVRCSAGVGAILMAVALYRRYRHRPDAYWWLASALVAGSPVLFLVGLDIFG